ncbi:MAG: oligosaccharide flippase family protein [Scrofimicrobium sp.]
MRHAILGEVDGFIRVPGLSCTLSAFPSGVVVGLFGEGSARRWLSGGTVGRSIAFLLSGTVLAQLIGLIVTIPLARLYSPSDFGLFAIFTATLNFGVTLATLRYDQAIVLPSDRLEAMSVQRLAQRLILMSSVVVTAIVFLARRPIVDEYESDYLLSGLLLAGVGVFFVAQIANMQMWLTREGDFSAIARNRVLQALLVGLFRIGFFWLSPNVLGLVGGFLTGQVFTLFLIARRVPEALGPLPDDAPKMSTVARRYIKMPFLNGPNAVLDSVRVMGINALIARSSVAGLGQYDMAWRLTMAPVMLVQGAVAQVMLRQMARAKRGELLGIVRRLTLRMAAVASPLFMVFWLVSPWVITNVFGSQWSEAGELARALTPWMYAMCFSTPLASVFMVTEKQQWLLLTSTLYTVAPLVFLAASQGRELSETVPYLSLIMAASLVITVLLAFWIARAYDDTGDTKQPKQE